jgi:protein SCO1/2
MKWPWKLCAVAGLVAACSNQAGSGGSGGVQLAASAADPAAFGAVADFSLTERSGESVTREALIGRTWVVDFFFSRCPNPCPVLSGNMRRLQGLLADDDVQLVSISVDPGHDTPEVLREYAETYGADADRWWFLTGAEQEIFSLMRESFALPVEKLPERDELAGLHITHASRLVTVDKEGRVRGYYDGETDEGVMGALRRARHLAGGTRSRLPAVNASLNGLAGLLLLVGLVAIKRDKRALHGMIMRAAFLVSVAFLASYLYYHFAVVSEIGPTRYNGTGWSRTAYLALLLSHTLLAVVNLPMVLRTLWLAHKERWEAHARLAKVTFPIWLYVSVTGVLVYLVLYVWNPAEAVA